MTDPEQAACPKTVLIAWLLERAPTGTVCRLATQPNWPKVVHAFERGKWVRLVHRKHENQTAICLQFQE